jgi:RimJ/RimL family protein N-acetyltransferase
MLPISRSSSNARPRLDRGWDALALTMDSCLIGYSIVPLMRGRGFGTRLAAELVARAKEIGYLRTMCRIRRTNLASIACAASAGVHVIELF